MSPCNRCGSLGILHLKAIGEPQEALVFCNCEWSKLSAQIWKLPRVTKKIEEAFNVTKCPLGWFRPGLSDMRIGRGRIMPNITPNVEKWHQRIKSAEGFWREYGSIFDFNDREPA